MYYLVTRNGAGKPTFIVDSGEEAAEFQSEEEAHSAAEGQPLCDAFGYAVVTFADGLMQTGIWNEPGGYDRGYPPF